MVLYSKPRQTNQNKSTRGLRKRLTLHIESKIFNTNQNSILNYESAALTAELRAPFVLTPRFYIVLGVLREDSNIPKKNHCSYSVVVNRRFSSGRVFKTIAPKCVKKSEAPTMLFRVRRDGIPQCQRHFPGPQNRLRQARRLSS